MFICTFDHFWNVFDVELLLRCPNVECCTAALVASTWKTCCNILHISNFLACIIYIYTILESFEIYASFVAVPMLANCGHTFSFLVDESSVYYVVLYSVTQGTISLFPFSFLLMATVMRIVYISTQGTNLHCTEC